MGIFRKEGVDVIDIPALQKKGIIKRAGYSDSFEKLESKDKGISNLSVDKRGFLDFTSAEVLSLDRSSDSPDPTPAPPIPSDPPTPSFTGNSLFGALDSLASSASSPSEQTYFASVDSSSPISSSNGLNGSSGLNLDINALKIKIEDLDYKLQRLIEKIEAMEKG